MIFGIGAGVLALGLVFVSALVVLLFFPNVGAEVGRMVVGSIILALGLIVLALVVIAVTHIDVKEPIRNLAVELSEDNLVDFYTLMPDTYRVTDVLVRDTDDDGKKEWVVFYRFDLADGRSPYASVVYDYDRGDPPVLFPYRLTPPDRNYLSEGEITLDLQDVISVSEPADPLVPEAGAYAGDYRSPTRELLVYGTVGGIVTDLTIFRHVRNSFEWEPPRDDQPRYQVVGAFRGNGGINLDVKARRVTVINRAQDRSQLAVEAVYALDETRATFMSASDPKQLNSPMSQRVTFAFGMPDDILDTQYPEKIVLGFYEMLGQSRPVVPPRDFLTGQALTEYERGNMAYFGFGGSDGDVSDLRVTELQYAPDGESQEPTGSTMGQPPGADGGLPQPRHLIVNLTFDSWKGAAFVRTPQPIKWITTVVNGKWRIDRHPTPE